MSPIRMASPEEIQEMLSRFDATPTDEILDYPEDASDRHRVWVTGWGFYFYVPELGPDCVCLYEVLLKICADLEQLRPDD